MKYEDFADHIRRMARHFAGETTHEDCPWSWEYARQKPGDVTSDRLVWRDWYVEKFKTALSVLGDQACGEIYRAEVARIRNAPSIYCHSIAEGAGSCPSVTVYLCQCCELHHCIGCDNLVNIGDTPPGYRHCEVKIFGGRWCWYPRCQRHRAATHGVPIERLPARDADPVLLAVRNMAASESWRAAGCPPGEIKIPPECPWSAGGWCGRHLPKDGGCRPVERKPG